MWWKDASGTASVRHGNEEPGTRASSFRQTPGASNKTPNSAPELMVAPSGNRVGERTWGEGVQVRRTDSFHAGLGFGRTSVRRLCVAAGLGVVLGVSALAEFALSSPTNGSAGDGMSDATRSQSVGFTPAPRDGDIIMHALNYEFSADPRTAEVIAWLSERKILEAVEFDLTMRVSRVTAEAIPAEGVELPTESFTTRGIRFNDAGEIVEILPASNDGSDSCALEILIAGDNPRNWTYFCVGSCTLPSECLLGINFPTLEIACVCLDEV